MNKPLPAKESVPLKLRAHNTMVYLRQHWQLYLIFMLPAFVLTIIFRYIPMGGVAIAFMDYNAVCGPASGWDSSISTVSFPHPTS